MSDVIDTIVAELSKKDTSGFAGTAKFVINGEGAVMMDASGVRAGDDDADVTLSADLNVFRAIFEGDMNPTMAFMTGKLKIDGSMGKAMALASVLS
ncbi:SCP2 sterol-binding domain-containing protein [Gemmobacter nectariphilus]|uniref:SCP2 sterol-binding domain-containing protein n=1 Tax=Gemmobacter nectariphilus TaxID=220343 RepID=UPI000408D3C1|nr:SCP2 sterol-binding domain-containing protein [Gemmobacter nectariphilus]